MFQNGSVAMAPDLLGFAAGGLVFSAYSMKGMVPLRIVSICSNIAFIGYGLGCGLAPIWLLHAALLPLNCLRLLQLVSCRRRQRWEDANARGAHCPRVAG
jgi:CRP/FNR family cyclic AMP-dependent transcriptional regulator